MDIYNVMFFGHRRIESKHWRMLETHIEKTISSLFAIHEYVDFYVGNNGDFDSISTSCVKRIQKKRGNDCCSLILALSYHYKDEKYYVDFYDEVIYPISDKVHFKAAITQRNRVLVENADLIICYVEKQSGGAYQAIRYAQQLGKRIINLADNLI